MTHFQFSDEQLFIRSTAALLLRYGANSNHLVHEHSTFLEHGIWAIQVRFSFSWHAYGNAQKILKRRPWLSTKNYLAK